MLNPPFGHFEQDEDDEMSHTIQRTLTRMSNATAIRKRLKIWPFRLCHTARCTWSMKSRSDMWKITKLCRNRHYRKDVTVYPTKEHENMKTCLMKKAS
ncbi:hypothetical protein PO124_18030 [Bacillus licheniformis]|nr:hypothetical protein [Bacillus licheniformis]